MSHARALEFIYRRFEAILILLDAVWRLIGYQRAEKPVAFVEKQVKRILFDCQMCGQCMLSSSGMSCPMNCPKSIRNGPCGGVRADGCCEVKADMRCVWVEAWRGSQTMRDSTAIQQSQPSVDFSIAGQSSWLAVARKTAKTAGTSTKP